MFLAKVLQIEAAWGNGVIDIVDDLNICETLPDPNDLAFNYMGMADYSGIYWPLLF